MSRTQFVVPQFLDVEPKIFGPITLRQFLLIVVLIISEFLVYRIFLDLLPMLGIGIPLGIIILAFAFLKVNGQPLHYMMLNVIQTVKKPRRRIWDKIVSDADLRVFLKKEPPQAPPVSLKKAPLETSRLAELTLVVNTGGVYRADDDV